MLQRLASILGLISLLFSAQAFACSGGQEWVDDVGMYTSDVTNDTPTIAPGQIVHFDFALINKSDPAYGPQEMIPYSDAEVSLLHGIGEESVFFQIVPYQKDREQAGFDYTFPNQHADYKLAIRYMKGTRELAATTVPVTVGNGDGILAGRGGIIAIAGTVLLLVLLMSTKLLRIRT